MREFIYLVTLIILSTISISGQTQISDIDQTERLHFTSDSEKLTVSGKDYFVTGFRSHLQFFDLQTEEITRIDVDNDCDVTYLTNYRVKGDVMYLIIRTDIYEIDLKTLTLVDRTRIDYDISTEWQFGSANNIIFEGRAFQKRYVGSIDLDTYVVTSQESSNLDATLVGDGAVLVQHINSEAHYVNLINGNEILLTERVVSTVPSSATNEFVFANEDSMYFRFSPEEGTAQLCDTVFDDGTLAYRYESGYLILYRFGGAFEPSGFFVLDTNTCTIVSLGSSFSEPSLLQVTVVLDRYMVINLATGIAIVDMMDNSVEDFSVAAYLALIRDVRDSIVYISYTSNTEGEKIVSYHVGTGEMTEGALANSNNSYAVRAVSTDSIYISGPTDQTVTLYSDSWDVVKEHDISFITNTGLSLRHPWHFSSTVNYTMSNHSLTALIDGSLTLTSEELFHPGAFMIGDRAYGAVNQEDSTFFVEVLDGDITYEEVLPPSPLSQTYNLGYFDGAVYLFTPDEQRRQVYPTLDDLSEEIPYTVDRIITQFDNTALCVVSKDFSYFVALYDGTSFDILSDIRSANAYRSTTSYLDNTTLRIMVIETESGSHVISYELGTGEIIFSEAYPGLDYAQGLSVERFGRWQTIYFRNQTSGEQLVLTTDGRDRMAIEGDVAASSYAGYSYRHVNGHTYVININNAALLTPNGELVQIPTPSDVWFLQDVYYHEGAYYATWLTGLDVVVTKADNPTLQDYETLYRGRLDLCRNAVVDNFFLMVSGDQLVFTLNNQDQGQELWSINLTTDDVQPLTEISEGPSDGFIEFQFYKNEKLYFSGNTGVSNTQLYVLDVNLLSSVEGDISQSNNDRLHIYPNPSTTRVTISEDLQDITAVDARGRFMPIFRNQQSFIDISHLESGMYILRGVDSKGVFHTGRFVKM